MDTKDPATPPAVDELTLQFTEALISADVLTTPAEVIYFLRRPDKYLREYEAWAAAGCPIADDPAWAATCAVIGAIADGDPPLTVVP